jgi:putative ribosome biogenesis GTPase RsgA
MKQTAVEFAVGKLEQFIPKGNQIVIKAILEHSKEMERQQISNAYQTGIIDGLNHQPRDYYNETFKNETTV